MPQPSPEQIRKKHSSETIEKIRQGNLGKIVPQVIREKISETMRGRKLSREHRRNIGEYLTGRRRPEISGENCYLWRGGVTPLHKQIRKLAEYKEWRSRVFERDNYTCKECGIRGGVLNADHYPKMFIEILQENGVDSLDKAIVCKELWDISYGRTLCVDCHQDIGKRTYVRQTYATTGIAC